MHSARALFTRQSEITGTLNFHHNSANKRRFYAKISVITLQVLRRVAL